MGDTMSEQQQNQGESQDKKVEPAEETKSQQPKESKLPKQAADKDDKADKPTDDDIEAKIREAVARERKKAIEETKAALKAEAEEKERLAKMAAEDRLKAEKEKAEKESAAAKAEATAAARKLELYRMLTTSGAQPAADTALPMIEQAFAAAIDGGADAAAAMKEVRKSMPFLFKQAAEDKAPDKKPMPDPQASTTTIQSQTSSTAAKRPTAPDPKTAKLDDYFKYFEQTKAAS